MSTMVRCTVIGCNNFQNKHNIEILKFCRFPNDPNLRKQWIISTGKDEISKDARICSDHFSENDWKLQDVLLNVSMHKRRLKEGVVPSKKLPFPPERTLVDEIRDTQARKELVKEALMSYDNYLTIEDDEESSDVEEIEYLEEEETGTAAVQLEYNKIRFFKKSKLRPISFCSREDPAAGKDLELYVLQSENQKLKRENQRLRCELEEIQSAYDSLNEIFTPGQIKRLRYPKSRPKWDEEDIESALGLYSASPRVYELLFQRQYPLPSSTTLRKWEKDRKEEELANALRQQKAKRKKKSKNSTTLHRRKTQRKAR